VALSCRVDFPIGHAEKAVRSVMVETVNSVLKRATGQHRAHLSVEESEGARAQAAEPAGCGLVEVGDKHDVAVTFVRPRIEDPLPVGGNGKTIRFFLLAQIGDTEIS